MFKIINNPVDNYCPKKGSAWIVGVKFQRFSLGAFMRKSEYTSSENGDME